MNACAKLIPNMDDHHCGSTSCHCTTGSSLFGQSLDEMDFERGVWCAAMNGELHKVKDFLENGVDPNARDRTGFTALHYASRSGHEDVCRLLLDKGADPNAQTRSGKATPLHRAGYCGHQSIVTLLLEHDANPGLCDSDGKTPLHKAAERQHPEIIRVILKNHPKLVDIVDSKGKKPCHYVDANNEELLNLLSSS